MESPACGGYQSQTQPNKHQCRARGNIVSVIIRFEGRVAEDMTISPTPRRR